MALAVVFIRKSAAFLSTSDSSLRPFLGTGAGQQPRQDCGTAHLRAVPPAVYAARLPPLKRLTVPRFNPVDHADSCILFVLMSEAWQAGPVSVPHKAGHAEATEMGDARAWIWAAAWRCRVFWCARNRLDNDALADIQVHMLWLLRLDILRSGCNPSYTC